MTIATKPVALCLAVVSTAGCWVRSVYPFYEQSDVVVDERLPGTWSGQGELSNCVLVITFDAGNRAYTVELDNADAKNTEGQCKARVESEGERLLLRGQLVQLGEAKFLDLVDVDRDGLDLLLKVEISTKQLALVPLDSESLASSMDDKTSKLQGRVEVFGGEYGAGPPPEARLTLVSATSDLRQFLLSPNSKAAFSESGRMTFSRSKQ